MKSKTATLRWKPGLRIEQRPALHAGARALRVDARRDEAAPAQLRQVEQIEGRDRRADAIELHAREQAAFDAQVEQSLVFEDREHQPRVLAVVGAERRRVFAVQAQDLLRRVGGVAVEQLAASEHRLRDGLEPVVGQLQRVAHQRDAVDHHASAESARASGA